VAQDGLGLDTNALNLRVGRWLAILLASSLLIGIGFAMRRLNNTTARVIHVLLTETSHLLTSTKTMLTTDLSLGTSTRHQNVNGIVRLIDVLESVLEVLKVDLSDFGNLGAPFGSSSASVSEDALASLCLLLESHVFEVILFVIACVARVVCGVATAATLGSPCL
jgi:hypothetical protein